MDEIRENLARLCREHGADYASLSKLLGRNSAYIQQYLKRGSPRRLNEDDRRTLAQYFGVSEDMLGARVGTGRPVLSPSGRLTHLIAVGKLGVGASAGQGSLAEDSEIESRFGFEERWLKTLTANPGQVSMIQVDGDSMLPTLSNGDDILVDCSAADAPLRDGIYVLRFEDSLMVKRLALNPVDKLISVRSDNPAYPDWEDCKPSRIQVIGKVVWLSRKI